jgi:glycosyltransferase involved in cell wall biosynthesis
MKKITLIHGNDGSDVRIGKMCRSLSRLGYDVSFIGWDRRPNAKQRSIDLGAAKPHIMQLATNHGRATILGQLKFTWFAIRSLRRQKPHVLCVVNEDLALMFLPFRKILFSKLVCDIFDPFDDRHSGKSLIHRVISKSVSFLSRTFCNHLIATDENRKLRLGKFGSKATVIENMPEDPGEELSKLIPNGPIKIYVSGTLNEGRGIKQIIEVAEKSTDVKIIAAGWTYDDYARDVFAEHSSVDFRGIVTLSSSLELASQCDAVLCFYTPTSDNNLNASPNKIFDAMSVGRPSIINSETKISNWVAEHGYGYSCPYNDVGKLSAIISSLIKERDTLSKKSEKWRNDFSNNYSWSLMEKRLAKLYKSL